MKSKVILIHGYNKTAKDMLTLKYNLEELNYESILMNLPLTVENLDHAIDLFEKRIDDMIKNLRPNEKIHLVGHSTGGLIIRIFLSKTKHSDRIGRCVLIATPNRGSKLADLAGKISKEFLNFFKTVKELQTKNVNDRNIKSIRKIEIGAIAGDKNNLFLGNLLTDENDGRIEVDSVKYDPLNDFLILPYNHKEIHHRFETAKFIDGFLRNGKFGLDEKEIVDKEKGEVIKKSNGYMPTAGGKIWWIDLVEFNGWRLQRNKLTGHCRILDPRDRRKAWGREERMRKIIEKIIREGK